MHFSKIRKAAILQLLKNGFIALQVSTRPSPHLNPMLEWDCLYGSAVPNGPIVRSLDDLWFNLEHRTKIYGSATSISGPTWTGPGARDLCGEKPATNRLSFGRGLLNPLKWNLV
jgi:hypothetical protein